MRHCSTAVPKSKSYRVRVIVNSSADQGSVHWRSDYYRFVGKSYAHVLINGVNKNVALSNHSDKIVGRSPPGKHAVNRVVWASGVYKPAGVKSQTVKCKSHHDPIARVNNQDSDSQDHITHSGKQYYSHEDSMAFSSFFSKNKFSLLENNRLVGCNDTNVTDVDSKCQIKTVMSNTHKKPVTKVSVDSNVMKNCAVDTVVSPVPVSRHKTVITSTRKQVSAVDGHKSKPNDFNVGAPSQDGASTKNVKNRDISVVREVKNNSKLTSVVKGRQKTITTANESKNKASGLGGGKFDLPSPLYSKFITSNARNIDSSLYSNDQNHSTVSPALDSHHEIITCSNRNVMDAAGSVASTKFHLHISPFMTRDKPGSKNRRVIIDLSYPPNHSVNACVQKDQYLGTDFVLTLPTIDNITDEIKKLGRQSLIYKVDISRAFRHVKIDPKDYYLLGLKLDQYYLDTCLPFGFRHGSSIFQRLSNAIRFIITSRGHKITNYIDDLIGHGVKSQIHDSFNTLLALLHDLGFQISDKKLIAPTTRATCLGVEVDTVNFTLAVPKDKLAQISSTCDLWANKNTCSKRDLQSLLGQLLYNKMCQDL